MVIKLTGRSRRKEGEKGKKENVEAEKDRRDVRSRGKNLKVGKKKRSFGRGQKRKRKPRNKETN